MKRREFIKYLGSAVAVPMLVLGSEGRSLTVERQEKNEPSEKRVHWTNTIFLQSEDQDIRSEVKQYASSTGCFVIYGERESPDIIALPYFAAVVDRSLVGRYNWESFVEYREDVNDRRLWIIADAIHDWPVPELDIDMAVVDPGRPGHAKRVIELIRKFRWSYLNR